MDQQSVRQIVQATCLSSWFKVWAVRSQVCTGFGSVTCWLVPCGNILPNGTAIWELQSMNHNPILQEIYHGSLHQCIITATGRMLTAYMLSSTAAIALTQWQHCYIIQPFVTREQHQPVVQVPVFQMWCYPWWAICCHHDHLSWNNPLTHGKCQ